MTPSQEFFEQLKEWSRWKHRILDKYLRIWVYRLSSRFPVLAFVDGCAGNGTYATGEDGSPRIAAKWNDQYLRARGKRLVVIACEADHVTAERLRNAMTPWTSMPMPEAAVLEGAFEELLPQLVAMTRPVPTFFFVDPYGMTSITADDLRPLLTDTARRPTEVLLRVDPGLLARFSGWLKPKVRDAKGQKTAASFRRFLERCNVRADVLEQFEADNGPDPSLDRDTILLAEYLRLFTRRFRYVQLLPVRPDYFAAPKYLLVHATNSPYGAAAINDALSTTEDELFTETIRREDEARGQRSLFDLEPDRRITPKRGPRVTIETAREAIVAIVQERCAVRFIDVRAALALQFGPDLREKDHKAALRRAIEAHQVELSDEKLGDRTVLRPPH